MDNSDHLQQLHSELQALKTKYQKNLSIDSELIMRYNVQKSSSTERARRLKLKYKRLAQRSTPYGSLFTSKQPGRPKADFRYRNRVGRKAVNLVFHMIYYYNNIYYLYRNFSKKEFPLLLHPWKVNVTDLRKVYIIIMYSTYIISLCYFEQDKKLDKNT